MKICYLVGAGDFKNGIAKKDGDIIIAADGGYDSLIQHGYAPELLIGDLDSIVSSLPCGIETISFPAEKNETDMFLGYLEGVKRGYDSFIMLGALGGDRLDHTLANISLLKYAKEHGHNIKISDKNCDIILIKNESVTLNGACGKYLSVLAVSGEARGVSICGAKYEVSDVTLSDSFPLGVSNEFKDREVTVSVNDGSLLIISSV